MSEKNTAINFDATNIQPSVPLESLPLGNYNVVIEESENAQTTNGFAVKLILRVLDGAYANRKAWDCINYDNANPVCQRIGQEVLSAICNITGIMTPKDTTLFHNKPMIARIGPDKEGNQTVKGYKAIEGAAPVTTAPPAPITAPPVAPVPQVVVAPPVAPPPPPPLVVAPPPVAVAWQPPQGWLAHPQLPGSYYCGQEVLTEADLKVRFPTAPPVAPPVTGAPALPTVPPVAGQPPVAPWEQPAPPAV